MSLRAEIARALHDLDRSSLPLTDPVRLDVERRLIALRCQVEAEERAGRVSGVRRVSARA